jgi:DNA repair exonuclease SbcCD ATPase subunit
LGVSSNTWNTGLEELRSIYNLAVVAERKNSEELTSKSAKLKSILQNKMERSKRDRYLEVKKGLIDGMAADLARLRLDYKGEKENITQVESSIKLVELEIVDRKVKITNILLDMSIIDFWREALSYKGVKSLLLDSFCNDFNNILKTYISDVSNGLIYAEFSPMSQTKSGESRNKLDLKIGLGGIDRTYSSLSGGEKRRVDISVCLAFSKWIQNHYNLSTSLLGIQIFDELFDGLDNSAEDCIAPVLQKEAENKAVFVISHSPGFSSYADRVITVEKRNNISSIRGIV